MVGSDVTLSHTVVLVGKDPRSNHNINDISSSNANSYNHNPTQGVNQGIPRGDHHAYLTDDSIDDKKRGSSTHYTQQSASTQIQVLARTPAQNKQGRLQIRHRHTGSLQSSSISELQTESPKLSLMGGAETSSLTSVDDFASAKNQLYTPSLKAENTIHPVLTLSDSTNSSSDINGTVGEHNGYNGNGSEKENTEQAEGINDIVSKASNQQESHSSCNFNIAGNNGSFHQKSENDDNNDKTNNNDYDDNDNDNDNDISTRDNLANSIATDADVPYPTTPNGTAIITLPKHTRSPVKQVTSPTKRLYRKSGANTRARSPSKDRTTGPLTGQFLEKSKGLIQTDSYIQDRHDDHILLNKRVTRAPSKVRRAATESALLSPYIPFHATKHSQIVPLPVDTISLLTEEEEKEDNSSNKEILETKKDSLGGDASGKLYRTDKANYSVGSLPGMVGSHYVHPHAHIAKPSFHLKTYSTSNLTLSSASRRETQVGIKRSETATREIKKMRESLLHRREMKRRRKTYLIDDDRVLIGNKVSEGHVNFIIAYNMLTGIRVAVSRCSGIMKPLTPKDFKYSKKLAFDYHGNELTPSSQYAFKFKDYCPEVFRELRAVFGLDPADYLVSLTSKYILSELNSPGKSGSFFYYSRDYKYIIKTVHHSEHIHLRKHLHEYYNHVKSNPDTLICQFYGLHRVKMPISFDNQIKHRKIYFLVMNNLFPPHLEIHTTYDLKGSTWGRFTQVDDTRKDVDVTYRPVLKDLNWIDNGEKIRFGPLKRKKFLEQLQRDIGLLAKLNIMDYSLLIGIHYVDREKPYSDIEEESGEEEEAVKEKGDDNRADLRYGNANIDTSNPVVVPTKGNVQNVVDKNVGNATPTKVHRPSLTPQSYQQRISNYGNRSVIPHFFKQYEGGIRATDYFNRDLDIIYYVGIIDCLTNYSIVKKLETFWRSLNHDRKTVSAVPPKYYSERMFSFIEESVDSTPTKRYKDDPGFTEYRDNPVT